VAGGYALSWPDSAELDRMLWPLATSALSLLLSEEVGRIKECAADDCHWLFLDSSRNQSRRWCDMKACGNRAKARHYYHRHQAHPG
jgi:predicted RNA-binding Zn ribbon-like protein